MRASDERHPARQANPHPSHQSPSQLWLGLILVQGPRHDPISFCCCLACWNIFMVRNCMWSKLSCPSQCPTSQLWQFSARPFNRKIQSVTVCLKMALDPRLATSQVTWIYIVAVGRSSWSSTRRLKSNTPLLSQLAWSTACMHTIWLPSGSRDQEHVNIHINNNINNIHIINIDQHCQ